MNKNYLKLLAIITTSLLILGCENSLTTDTYSQDLPDSEKLPFLAKYLRVDEGILDAEYHIWYQDNSNGFVPGPTDYTMLLALKVHKDSLHQWNNKATPSSPNLDTYQWEALDLDSTWKMNTTQHSFHKDNGSSIQIVYPETGEVLLRYSTMPFKVKFDSIPE